MTKCVVLGALVRSGQVATGVVIDDRSKKRRWTRIDSIRIAERKPFVTFGRAEAKERIHRCVLHTFSLVRCFFVVGMKNTRTALAVYLFKRLMSFVIGAKRLPLSSLTRRHFT